MNFSLIKTFWKGPFFILFHFFLSTFPISYLGEKHSHAGSPWIQFGCMGSASASLLHPMDTDSAIPRDRDFGISQFGWFDLICSAYNLISDFWLIFFFWIDCLFWFKVWTLQEKVQNKSALLQSHLPMPPLPQRRRGSFLFSYLPLSYLVLSSSSTSFYSSCFRTLYLILKNDMIWSDKTSNRFFSAFEI